LIAADALAFAAPAAPPTRTANPPSDAYPHGLRARFRALQTRLHDLDPACDLAEDIGSPRWWRGVVSLVGLMLAAWLLLPGTSPLSAAVPVAIDQPTIIFAARPRAPCLTARRRSALPMAARW
jgi:hypothetical protein